MSPRVRFILIGTIIMIVLKFFVFPASAQTTNAVDVNPGAKIFGSVNLTTNYIEYGVTQSDKSFALQTGVGYRWPAFKLGLWGSNVKFANSGDTLNLRLYLSTKLTFTANFDTTLRYDFNRYYTGGDHNGGIISVDFRYLEYHFIWEKNDNWEGVGALTRYGFTKDFRIPWDMILNVNAGYNMISATGFTNYFDVKTQATYKWGDLNLSLGNSYNSKPSQFDGRGDIFFYLATAAQF